MPSHKFETTYKYMIQFILGDQLFNSEKLEVITYIFDTNP